MGNAFSTCESTKKSLTGSTNRGGAVGPTCQVPIRLLRGTDGKSVKIIL